MKVIEWTAILAAVVIISVDIGLYAEHGAQATLSYWMLTEGKARPIIPFGFDLVIGTLAGHFWWSQ